MVIHQLQSTPSKGTLATQPFVDNNSQGILISSRNRPSLPLFGCHVQCCSNRLFRSLGIGIMSYSSDAKVTEQDFVLCSKEYVLWLDIPMNTPVVMGVLQGSSDLFDVRDNGSEWKVGASGMALQEGAIGRILHHKKRDIILSYPEVEDLHDVGMPE